MVEKKSTLVHVRISEQMNNRIKAEAQERNESVSDYMRELVEQTWGNVTQDNTQNLIKLSPERYESLAREATKCNLNITELIESKLDSPKVKGEVPAIVKEFYDSLEWANLLSAEENCKNLVKAINDGKITFTNQGVELNVEMPIDVSRFIEACEAKGIDPQKRLDEQTEWVKRERVNKS